MAKVTLFFSALLVALGLAGYIGTGSEHPTALIPTWIGMALAVGGLLAISPDEGRRKLFMHINVTIGLLGFLGGAGSAVRGYLRTTENLLDPITPALESQVTLALLMLIYVLLCVRSFINARRTGKV